MKTFTIMTSFKMWALGGTGLEPSRYPLTTTPPHSFALHRLHKLAFQDNQAILLANIRTSLSQGGHIEAFRASGLGTWLCHFLSVPPPDLTFLVTKGVIRLLRK